jgi:Galactose oxidase, central domain
MMQYMMLQHFVHADYFGGRVGKDMGEGSMNDLWSFDTSTNTWTEVQAQHGEPPCKVSLITLCDTLSIAVWSLYAVQKGEHKAQINLDVDQERSSVLVQ